MDRLRWCSDGIEHRGAGASGGVDEEALVCQQSGVRLHDGSKRTGYESGIAKLTTHRLLWCSSDSCDSFIALPLAAVLSAQLEEGSGLVRAGTPKLCLRLLSVPALVNVLASLPHPMPWIDRWVANGANFSSAYAVVPRSDENQIKLGFTRGGHREFERALQEVLGAKTWSASIASSDKRSSTRAFGSVGIGAIERQQAARAGATDTSLEEAFDDLNKLISRASEMVSLSRNLAKRSRESKGGDLTTDETTQLRSAMLSMGVIDEGDNLRASTAPSSGSGSFHSQLAHQLSDILTPLLTQRQAVQSSRAAHDLGAGCIDLASAYCRINRARGMQLTSPDDLLRACHLLHQENLPLRLKAFPSGLLVLQLASENEMDTLKATAAVVEENTSLTAEELARTAGLSILLARERLLAMEHAGLVCRDDSEAGLRFYPNLFLTREA